MPSTPVPQQGHGDGIARNLIRWMLSEVCPPELFDWIVGWLPLADQASLSSTNRGLRKKVVPVFNRFVWRNPPASLPAMVLGGRMQWGFVVQAGAAAFNGYIACPWCRSLHSPLSSIDVDDHFNSACRLTTRDSYEVNNQNVVSLYERPVQWHPNILMGLLRYIQLGRDTSLLRSEAQLDRSMMQYSQLATQDDGTQANVVFAEEEWKLIWQPSVGLFIRCRHSEILSPAQDTGSLTIPCCSCQRYSKAVFYTKLFEEKFPSAVLTEFQPGIPGIDDTEEEVMLSEDGRLSPTLVAGPVRGCGLCGIDWQAAWRRTDHNSGGILYWTTWFFLGNPDSVIDLVQAVTDRTSRIDWDAVPTLGLGNVARLSGLTDDYYHEAL